MSEGSYNAADGPFAVHGNKRNCSAFLLVLLLCHKEGSRLGPKRAQTRRQLKAIDTLPPRSVGILNECPLLRARNRSLDDQQAPRRTAQSFIVLDKYGRFPFADSEWYKRQ